MIAKAKLVPRGKMQITLDLTAREALDLVRAIDSYTFKAEIGRALEIALTTQIEAVGDKPW